MLKKDWVKAQWFNVVYQSATMWEIKVELLLEE